MLTMVGTLFVNCRVYRTAVGDTHRARPRTTTHKQTNMARNYACTAIAVCAAALLCTVAAQNPPAGTKEAIPRVTINLDEPPRLRWQKIANELVDKHGWEVRVCSRECVVCVAPVGGAPECCLI